MIIRNVKLQNFRSYRKRIFEFSPETTLIVGDNTSGKTNILEAIYLISLGKSFRAEKDSEMIMWGEQVGRATAEINDAKLEVMLTTGLVGGQKAYSKKFSVNGIPKRSLDFVGNLKSVLFWPEDLELVTDSPSLRRRYLDRVLVQVDREYRRNLMSYERGLRQRNKLLDLINVGTASRQQLLFWDQLLIKSGGYITDKRAEYIDYINRFQMSDFSHQKIDFKFQIEYDKSVISQSRLEQYKIEEVSAKATLVGPHRDDFIVSKFQIPIRQPADKSQMNPNPPAGGPITNQKLDLSKYGSRGEQRLGVLWIKLAELSYIQEMTNDRPVLLLDDIFSELDENHRNLVLDLIVNYQSVITSAETDVLDLLTHHEIDFQAIKLNDI